MERSSRRRHRDARGPGGYRVSASRHRLKSMPAAIRPTSTWRCSPLVPATHPKIATVVVIDEPSSALHQGGQWGAGILERDVGRAAADDVPPDDLQNVPRRRCTASDTHERNGAGVSLTWLLRHRAGSRRRRSGAGPHPDSREVLAGSLSRAARRNSHGLEFAAEAAARRSPCCGTPTPRISRAPPPGLGRRVPAAPVPRLKARRAHRGPVLRWPSSHLRWSHHGDQGNHLRLSARAALSRLNSDAATSARSAGAHRRLERRPTPPRTPSPCIGSCRGCARLGPRRRDGSILARADQPVDGVRFHSRRSPNSREIISTITAHGAMGAPRRASSEPRPAAPDPQCRRRFCRLRTATALPSPRSVPRRGLARGALLHADDIALISAASR